MDKIEQFQLEKYEGIDLGDEFKEAKASLNLFKDSIEKLKSYLWDTKNVKYEYFAELRTKIDLDRENINDKVSNHFFCLIAEVNEIETTCKENELKNVDVLAKVIENEEIKLNGYKKKMDVLKIDTKHWDDLKMKSNNHIAIVKRKIKDLEMELFSDNTYTYKQLDFEQLDYEILNKAEIMRSSIKQRSYENFGSFYCNKYEFKKFSEAKGSTFYSNVFIFNELTWKLQLQNQNREHLGFYIVCDPGTIKKEVNCKIKIQLSNIKDSERNFVKEFDYKYTKMIGNGYSDVLSFKEIFNNDFYDIENDSINFLVSIQIKDIC